MWIAWIEYTTKHGTDWLGYTTDATDINQLPAITWEMLESLGVVDPDLETEYVEWHLVNTEQLPHLSVKSEARKLAEAYYAMYPKEHPGLNPTGILDQVIWDSVEITFQNWLERMKENPQKVLGLSNWTGKVTFAYLKLHNIALPKWPRASKSKVVQIVKEYLNV
jgi:hypothetical protein